MITINQNGLKIQEGDKSVTVNGKVFEIPKHVQSKFGSSLSVINKQIIINGYILKPETGEWKLSIKYKYGWIFKVLLYVTIAVIFLYGLYSLFQ